MTTPEDQHNGCLLALEWGLDVTFAVGVAAVIREFELHTSHGLEVISGFRTDRQQRDLGRRGRPAAPVDVSNHTRCPATAVDFRIIGFATDQTKTALGEFATFNGLRWGGGSAVDPQTGIPSDWPHVDTGPRRS